MSTTDQATKVAYAGLRAPATAGATSLSIELITGAWPTVPFAALLEDGTSRKEQVSVTGVSGTTLTVTRAQGGTSAVAHDTSSAVEVITTLADLGFLETVLAAGADLPAHVAAADPHTGYVLDAGLAAHEADTTAIHGITDTSALALTSALTAHDIDTTAVHGITDTAQVALKNAAQTFTRKQIISPSAAEDVLILRDGGSTGFTVLRFESGAGVLRGQFAIDANTGGFYMDSGEGAGGGDNIFRVGGTERLRLTNGGDLKVQTAGKGLQIKEGSNARMGVSTLVAGAVVVSNTSVTADSRILLTVQSLGTVAAAKAVAVTARTASTSFTITSEDNTDTSVVAWFLMEPAA